MLQGSGAGVHWGRWCEYPMAGSPSRDYWTDARADRALRCDVHGDTLESEETLKALPLRASPGHLHGCTLHSMGEWRILDQGQSDWYSEELSLDGNRRTTSFKEGRRRVLQNVRRAL